MADLEDSGCVVRLVEIADCCPVYEFTWFARHLSPEELVTIREATGKIRLKLRLSTVAGGYSHACVDDVSLAASR